MKSFFLGKVPFWVVMFLFLLFSSGAFLVFSFFRQEVLNYELLVSSMDNNGGEILSYGEQPTLSNPNFFKKVKEEFITQKVSFIEADLSDMSMRVYEEGLVVKEIEILSKGREGSWWETPSGLYKVVTKEKNHFSSFGRVYQPWSMAFQGNFFIHGWPYYPDGTPVASAYSGGCIRLDSDDAQAIYDLVKVGTPVLVFEKGFFSDDYQYHVRVPSLSTSHYIVADLQNNFVFGEKKSRQPISFHLYDQFLGSLVMTDYINIEKEIFLSKRILKDIEDENFIRNEDITPYDLLHLMLIGSSESSMHVFANYIGERRFTSLINSKVQAIGMKDTVFSLLPLEKVATTSTSTLEVVEENLQSTTTLVVEEIIDENLMSTTTAEDLLFLAKYVYNNRRFLFDISIGKRTNTLYEVSRFADTKNENIFFDDPRFVGGKATIGKDGKESFWGVFEIEINGEERPFFIFLKDSPDVRQEVLDWLAYISDLYQKQVVDE